MKCEHEGCDKTPVECIIEGCGDEDDDVSYLCPEHAAEQGYCRICGQFWGGIESFDFYHPGYCDNCHAMIQADTDDEQDGDMSDYLDPADFCDE